MISFQVFYWPHNRIYHLIDGYGNELLPVCFSYLHTAQQISHMLNQSSLSNPEYHVEQKITLAFS